LGLLFLAGYQKMKCPRVLLKLAGPYASCGIATGAIVASSGPLYDRLAQQDSSGLLESDVGRGLAQIGKGAVAAVLWPVV
jgi:hypothetical protein